MKIHHPGRLIITSRYFSGLPGSIISPPAESKTILVTNRAVDIGKVVINLFFHIKLCYPFFIVEWRKETKSCIGNKNTEPCREKK